MAQEQNTGKAKKPKSNKRQMTGYIRARVSPDQKEEFNKRCKDSGLDPADYIRLKCLDEEPLRKFAKRTVSEELMAKVLAHAGKMGGNINQIAHSLNIALLAPDVKGTVLVQELRRHQSNLDGINEALLEIRSIIREILLHRDPAR